MTGLAVVAPTLELAGSAAVAVDNPFGPSWLPTWLRPYDTAVATTTMLVFQVTVIVAGVGVVLRFRRSAGIERLQLRWFVFAAPWQQWRQSSAQRSRTATPCSWSRYFR